MLNKALSHSPQRNSLQSAFWRVFAILLEYCCKTNYQMLLKKIQSEHKKELEGQEQDFLGVQDRLFDNERKLKMEVDRLSKENGDL